MPVPRLDDKVILDCTEQCFGGYEASHSPQAQSTGALVLHPSSPVLHHAHGHPVRGVNVLPNEILEHDERFHQEVLEE